MEFLKTVEWIPADATTMCPGRVRMVDQTLLPNELKFVETDDLEAVWHAIKILQVRGAPAIGVAAAMGVIVGIQSSGAITSEALLLEVQKTADYLATSRPTAVNLFWALDRMKRKAGALVGETPEQMLEQLAIEAEAIRAEDVAMCRSIGEHGAALLEDGATILTHCNAGSLATAQYGTALSPVYMATEQGKKVSVYADETRPLLQGARLTAWELMQAGVDVTLICDNMAAQVMKEGRIDAVMVGSDRIAGNGDVANKIGTYGVALLAKAHNIPFYVLAPTSTVDLSLSSGDEIPIELRGDEEVTMGFGKRTAPEGVKVYTPAFDVTPAELVHGIICEKGIARPPYTESLAAMVNS